MFSIRDFWRRHRRKLLVTAGVIGSGYLLYKLYEFPRRLESMQKELALQRENDELLKAQMRAHFENIQMISESITLPHAMHDLNSRISEELDLSQLLERLIKGKGQPNTLTSLEKLDLWDRLKILSFTRMALSVWAMTMLNLYRRVQVNILGRYLYIDTARSLRSSYILEGADVLDREDQQKFLGSVNYFFDCGMPKLISDMEASIKEVIQGKKLRDFISITVLHNIIMQILDTFMSTGSPHHWVNYMMPENTKSWQRPSSSDGTVISDFTKFDQLMVETQAVLSSAEFGNVVEISLKVVVDKLVDDMGAQFGGGILASGVPLAKVLPQVAQMCPLLLEEPSKNQFIQLLKNIPEVELFFTLLYSNMPAL
ncbi:peroxisome biogenesis protein 3-2 [Quillaja saponaria]|uniref:Peroxisome biogenesis protein 3-2 n=1 Tax=Quillaja saponaria TaxID=32244 RepID=A0AAD7PVZ5_QUISA|nr:peroxisome biogenesis protein 3-2 [Quillaja saponaria]